MSISSYEGYFNSHLWLQKRIFKQGFNHYLWSRRYTGLKGLIETALNWEIKQPKFSDESYNEKEKNTIWKMKDENENWFVNQYDILQVFTLKFRRRFKKYLEINMNMATHQPEMFQRRTVYF